MILGGDFLYHGLLRWNLGWPTPNYAGAFVATLLVFAFAFSGSRWCWTALAVEAGGLYLLAKTYSRGAVVAWVAACLFAVMAGRVWRERREIRWWGTRAALLGVMLWAVGFGWSRAPESGGATVTKQDGEQSKNTGGRPGPLSDGASASDGPAMERGPAEDGSVVNRLALWRGGAAMIAAAPWNGWGAGESGRVYMNWFQDVDRDEGFSTMVNSFLHVGVEYGLGVLAAVLAGLGAVLAMAWQAGRGKGERSSEGLRSGALGITRATTAAGASLVAWAVANVFTTLWIDWKLWIVPGVAIAIIVWSVLRGTGLRPVGLAVRSAAGFGTVIALAGSLGLLLTGHVLAARSPHWVEPTADGAIAVRTRTESAGGVTVSHLWPDPAVLGPTPGKELRRWFATRLAGNQWIVHRANPAAPWMELGDASGVILFGRQAERLAGGGALGDRPLRVIHPLGAPPAGAARALGSTELILPAIDEAGNGPAWRAWAVATGARVSESPGAGLDVRAAWAAAAQAGGGP